MSLRSPNPTDAYVGSRIRLRRNMLGMSQERLAAHLGVTFQQVQKYEKGTNRVGASRLQTIAATLAVPIGFFFQQENDRFLLAGVGAPSDERALADFVSTKEAILLNKAFHNIDDPKIRRLVIGLTKAIADADPGDIRLGDDTDLDAHVTPN